MVDKRELIGKYERLQGEAIELALELVKNAKQRRGEMQKIWQTFQQERQKTFYDRKLEQFSEKSERIFKRYTDAKAVLKKGNKLTFVEEGEIKKVMAEEKAVRLELQAMQRDENAEGQAIKKEIELTNQEMGELEKVERILQSKKNKLLSETDLLEIEKLLEGAQTAIVREIQEQQFQERLNVQEAKIAGMMGNLESQMSKLEFAERKQSAAWKENQNLQPRLPGF